MSYQDSNIESKNSSSSLLNNKKPRSLSDINNRNTFEKYYFYSKIHKNNPIINKFPNFNSSEFNKNDISIFNNDNNKRKHLSSFMNNNELNFSNNLKTHNIVLENYNSFRTRNYQIHSRNLTNERSVLNQNKNSLQTLLLNSTLVKTDSSSEKKISSIPQSFFKTYENSGRGNKILNDSNSLISKKQKNSIFSNLNKNSIDINNNKNQNEIDKKNKNDIEKYNIDNNNNNINKINYVNIDDNINNGNEKKKDIMKTIKKFKSLSSLKHLKLKNKKGKRNTFYKIMTNNIIKESKRVCFRNSLILKEKTMIMKNIDIIFDNNILEKKEKSIDFLEKFEKNIKSKYDKIENNKNFFKKELVYKQSLIVFNLIEKIEKNLIVKQINTIEGSQKTLKQIFMFLFRKTNIKEFDKFIYKANKFFKYYISSFILTEFFSIHFDFIPDKYLDLRKDVLNLIFNEGIENINNKILKRNLAFIITNKNITKSLLNNINNKEKIQLLLSLAKNRKKNFLFFQELRTKDIKKDLLNKNKINIKSQSIQSIQKSEDKIFSDSKDSESKDDNIKIERKSYHLQKLIKKEIEKTIDYYRYNPLNNKNKNEIITSNDLKFHKIQNNFYKNIFYHIEKENDVLMEKLILDNLGSININYKDENGNTFLNFASKNNCKIEIIQFLLLHECNPNITNVIILLFNFLESRKFSFTLCSFLKKL